MSQEKALTAFAGFMVLLSVALTYWVHPNFVWLTVFVGANLFLPPERSWRQNICWRQFFC